MSKVTELTKEFQRVMYSTTYSFEIDTEDYVFGFKNTIKKRTKSLAKALKLEQKVTRDCGRFLSDTVRIVSVRIYKNGELRKELHAEEITAAYNG
jgi:ribosomal protein L30E